MISVVMSIHFSLVVTCWERVNLLAFLYVMLSCVFVTFLCGVLYQVCDLIVSMPDLSRLTYFVHTQLNTKYMMLIKVKMPTTADILTLLV